MSESGVVIGLTRTIIQEALKRILRVLRQACTRFAGGAAGTVISGIVGLPIGTGPFLLIVIRTRDFVSSSRNEFSGYPDRCRSLFDFTDNNRVPDPFFMHSQNGTFGLFGRHGEKQAS